MSPDADALNVGVYSTRALMWLSLATLLSATFAAPLASDRLEASFGPFSGAWLPRILFAVLFGVAALIQKYAAKMTVLTAVVWLIVFACLNGVIYAALFPSISEGAVAYGFFVTALAFGISAALGHWRQTALTSGSGVGMLLGTFTVTLLACNIANGADHIRWAASFLVSCTFASVFMYHGDDLEQFAAGTYEGEPTAEPRTAIFGALTVYLDFVLLLLLIMSALGRLNEREAVED